MKDGGMRRGYFSIGIFHSKSPANIGTLWRTAHCFGASFIFTVGKRYDWQQSDTMKSERHVPLFNFATIDDLRAHLPKDCDLIGIELHERAKLLTGFSHPARACYLLGAEDRGLNDDAVEACHRIVQIPGAARCLNVATAGSIVIYDRISKKA